MALFRCGWSRRLVAVQSLRTISTSHVSCCKTALTPDENKKENPMDILQGSTNHRVNNLEKRFLVWAGKYKRIEDVPRTVPQETMEKARNKARIKIANYMMLATVVACIGFVYSGKQAAKRGESVQKMNLDWHREVHGESKK